MVTGIVCEYNPFHRGHEVLLQAARSLGADTVVCAMSGNFVQRGDFAAVNKAARAEMAVRCGADLVLELPTPWAMAGAESFARGGVSLLSMAGCDSLLFGSECGELAPLQALAEATKVPDFMDSVRQELSRGVTYAAARQTALSHRVGDAALLESPNNTLGVEYLKANASLSSPMTPYTISRQGAAHHGQTVGGYASASYLRQLLKAGEEDAACLFMPPAAADILRREVSCGRIAAMDRCERAMLSCLRRMDEEDLRPYDGGGEGLYHRLFDAMRRAATWEEMLQIAKTKRYPLSRLRRMALRIYLEAEEAPEQLPYLRVLAANSRGRAHLHRLRQEGAPLLTKAADVSALGTAAELLFRAEARRTDLYTLSYTVPAPPGEDWRITPFMA